jgi:hypothetical protein
MRRSTRSACVRQARPGVLAVRGPRDEKASEEALAVETSEELAHASLAKPFLKSIGPTASTCDASGSGTLKMSMIKTCRERAVRARLSFKRERVQEQPRRTAGAPESYRSSDYCIPRTCRRASDGIWEFIDLLRVEMARARPSARPSQADVEDLLLGVVGVRG